jgi:hypothetical protein
MPHFQVMPPPIAVMVKQQASATYNQRAFERPKLRQITLLICT